MENLEDFRYYFSDEREIDAFVATDETLIGPEQRIQIARVRQAWATVRQNGKRKESYSNRYKPLSLTSAIPPEASRRTGW